MKPSLSIRMFKVAFRSFVIAILWYFVAWLIAKDQESPQEVLAVLSIYASFFSTLAVNALIFLGRWALKPKWFIAPVLWGTIGYIGFNWWEHFTNAVVPLLISDLSAEQWKLVFKIYSVNGGAGFLIALLPVAFIFNRDRLRENKYYKQWFLDGKGTGGDWAGIASFLKNGMRLTSWFSSDGLTTSHILLGKALYMDDPRMPLIGDKQNSHNILTAGARSGKSISAIWNVLLTHSKPAIVFDPRGEHSRQTFYRRSSRNWLIRHGLKGKAFKHLKGGQCFCLDPFGETGIPSWNYNPLSEIDPNSPRIRELLSAISAGCVSAEKGENKHFEEFAKYLIEGVIAHVICKYSKQNRNLVFVYNLLNGIDNELGVAKSERFNELLVDMLMDTESAGGLPAEAALRLKDMGDRERGSVLSSVARSLKWVSDPSMRQHLTGESNLRFSQIGTQNEVTETVYIVLPEGLMSESGQMRWFRTLTNLSVVLLRNRPNVAKIPTTLLILDEFARLGKVQAISEGISTLMGDKIKLYIALQNLGQLMHDYPERWNSFIANSTLQFFGVHDMETASFISNLLGIRTVKTKHKRTGYVSERKLPLMTPQEIMAFLGKNRNRQIVFPVDGMPMRLERITYKPIKGYNAVLGLFGHYEF